MTTATLPFSRPLRAAGKRNAAAIRLDFPIFDEQSLAIREIADAAEPRRPGHHLGGIEIDVAGRVRLLEVVADGKQPNAFDEHDLRREAVCAACVRRLRRAAARRAAASSSPSSRREPEWKAAAIDDLIRRQRSAQSRPLCRLRVPTSAWQTGESSK